MANVKASELMPLVEEIARLVVMKQGPRLDAIDRRLSAIEEHGVPAKLADAHERIMEMTRAALEAVQSERVNAHEIAKLKARLTLLDNMEEH